MIATIVQIATGGLFPMAKDFCVQKSQATTLVVPSLRLLCDSGKTMMMITANIMSHQKYS